MLDISDPSKSSLPKTGWHDDLIALCDQLGKGAEIWVVSGEQKAEVQFVAKRLRRPDLRILSIRDDIAW